MRIVILCLFCLLLFGCGKRGDSNQLLRQADSLMESRPDSALAILQKISKPHRLTDKEQADYCLLLTQAEYKNYLPFTSDSLLTIAIAYYRAIDDKALLGESYYYAGCFYNEKGDYVQAAEQYKQAEALLKQTGDNVLLALLYNAMGHLNRKNDLKEEALQQFKKALYYSEHTSEVYHIAMNIQGIANLYLSLDKPDSAGIYFTRIVPYLFQCEKPKMATLFHNIGVYNEDYGSLDLAEKYVLKSLELEKDTANRIGSYYALARIYRRQGHINASDSLWNVVLDSMTDMRRKGDVYRDLFQQSVLDREYEKAVSYANKGMLYMDSAYCSSIAKDVAEVQAKYDDEVLLRKNAEQRTENIVLWICILGVLLTGAGAICLIIHSHKKYKAKKECEISCLIAKYQEELDQLESKHSVSKEESEKLALLIKEKEEQIELLRKKKELYAGRDGQAFVLEGLDLDLALRKSMDEVKMLRMDVPQFKAYISYCKKTMPEFTQALKECRLTDYEMVVCILFSIPLTHKQVCEMLCKSSETLSRTKLRLKDKMKKNGNECVLEKIRSVLGLNL